jgi:hypothetical protein
MYKLLTVFNIIAGAASIAALLIQQLAPNDTWPRQIVVPLALIAGGLCLYVLLVPETWLERNVRTKVQRYTTRVDPSNTTLVIQEGRVRFFGFSNRTVRFHEPFASPPEVELVDTYGDFAREGGLPEVMSKSEHAFVMHRSGGLLFAAPKCDWIARGIPLEKAQA